jgi:hypothetical protein
MNEQSKHGPQDSGRINIEENQELLYWAERFRVSTEQVKKAVREVGPSARAVEMYIGKNR